MREARNHKEEMELMQQRLSKAGVKVIPTFKKAIEAAKQFNKSLKLIN